MYLSAGKLKILSKVIQTLAEPYGETQVRELMGRQLLDLLDADYYASYVWSNANARFGHRVALNMGEANLARYESYYQFHDPITPLMQAMRRSVLVEEVMPQHELIKTEFFNDFLALDGLYWGVNMYAWQGDDNLGDVRIWRDRRRDRFDLQTRDILELLKPAFTAALCRCRHQGLYLGSQPMPEISAGNFSAKLKGHALLSRRENEIAQLAATGFSDKQIARTLNIAFTTVRTHLSHAYRKLGVENRVQLARHLGL